MRQRVQKDPGKARSLAKLAQATLDRLQTTDIYRYPTNALIDYYDIIHLLLEAVSANDGVKVKGEGAHRELIDYVCREHGLGEPARVFLQDLREYRNRAHYEGFAVKQDYIVANQDRTNRFILMLMRLL